MRTALFFLISGAVATVTVVGLALLFATRLPSSAPDTDRAAPHGAEILLAHDLSGRAGAATGAVCPVSGHSGFSKIPFREALKRQGHPDLGPDKPAEVKPLAPAIDRIAQQVPLVLEV